MFFNSRQSIGRGRDSRLAETEPVQACGAALDHVLRVVGGPRLPPLLALPALRLEGEGRGEEERRVKKQTNRQTNSF